MRRLFLRILSLIITMFFLLNSLYASNGSDDTQKILDEILNAYKSGEESLREYARENKDRISNEIITGITSYGVQERNEGKLNLAIIIAEEKGDEGIKADVYMEIAYYGYLTSQNDLALKYCELALPIYEKMGNLSGQGNVYKRRGDIYLRTGDNENALKMYEKALPFYEKANDPVGQGNVYKSRGDIYFYTGDNENALKMYEKALPFYEKANDPVGQGNVYQSRGDIYLRTGDNENALKMYEKAITLYTKIGDIESHAYTLFKKAKISEKGEALKLYEAGLSKLEKVRKQTGFSEMKKTFMEKVYTYYDEATAFMLKNGYNDKAFKYAESMKARVFLDQLAEGLIDLEKGIAPELTKKRDEIENRLSMFNKQRTDEVQKQKPDEAKIKTLQAEIAKAEEELEEIKRQIRLKNPLYASVQYPEPIMVKELQSKVLKKDEVILEYFVSEQGVYCFVITEEGFEVIKLALGKDELEKEVEEFLKPFNDTVTYKKLQRFGVTSAKGLYETLIKPAEDKIKDKALIIIPDGVLAKLPFEALMIDTGTYLLEKYRIKYVQSASVLHILRTQYKKEGLSDKFIGFGDPVYDYESFKAEKPEKGSDIKGIEGMTLIAQHSRSGYVRAGGKLDRLVGSGKEVKEIEKIFREKRRDERGYLRLDAKEGNAKSDEMEGYGYIHFSTHGILDSRFQAIALSQIPDAKEDGMLTLGEIMNLRYNARLVVLSACQTGLGKMERGEGVTGLTRAVMYAGSPAVVVSLWSVSDIGTKELMVKFYKNMVEKEMTKEDALREAKKEMLKNKDFKHPFFWSAFVMYGE